jgi:hypothetical protein
VTLSWNDYVECVTDAMREEGFSEAEIHELWDFLLDEVTEDDG